MSKKISVAAVIVFSLFCPPLFADYCGNFPVQPFGGSTDLPHTGVYRNYSYAFSISIPNSVIAYGAAPPLPDHGVGILLSWEPRSYIYVGADSNSFLYESLAERKHDHLKWLAKDSLTIVSVKHLSPIVKTLESIRFVVRHTCPNLNGIYVDDYIIAFRPDKSVLYTISLSTTENRYSADKLILERIARSLKMDEIKS